MTGAEHAREAEQLLVSAEEFALVPEGRLGMAQVHATLALVAQQRRIADLLDPMAGMTMATIHAIVSGTHAGAVRVEVRQP